MTLPPYSVLMSVYAKENSRNLRVSLESLISQTVPANEFVIVEDGPLTEELDSTIASFCSSCQSTVQIIKLPKNEGLGYSLAKGLLQCSNETVARMDSDDYAFPTRVEEQLSYMEDEGLDIVGSQVTEFTGEPSHVITYSTLPTTMKDILRYSKHRNPFRHPSVIFKKSQVLQAGNYSSDFIFFEDWELFNRMLSNGCTAGNINKPLVAMRINSDYFSRRGGIKYIKCMLKFKTSQLQVGNFSFFEFITSTFPHIIVCLLPNFFRSTIYLHLLRKGNPE